MKKLVCFGDSFIDANIDQTDKTWYKILSQNLKIPILNYGKSATSIEFSINNLFEYINSENYDPSDIIVFVYTSFYRVPLIHENFISEHAAYWITYLQGGIPKTHPAFNTYNKDHKFYETLFRYTDLTFIQKNRILLTLALKALPNSTLCLSAFKDIDIALKPHMRHLLNPTENFLYINTDLELISRNEIVGHEYNKIHGFFKGEPRENHLGYSNHQILARQLLDCIANKTNKYFDQNAFRKQYIDITNIDEETFHQEFKAGWKKILDNVEYVNKWARADNK